VRKVYSILTVQLLITFLFCLLSLKYTWIQDFQKSSTVTYVLMSICTMTIMCCLMCCKKTARQVPTNYILLFTFTFCEAYLVSLQCSFYDAEIVIQAALMTLIVTIGMTAYAYTTKSDFTSLKGLCYVLLFAIFGNIICMIFWVATLKVRLFSLIGVIIYGVYII